MTPDRHRRIDHVFDAAQRQPAAGRAAFLDEICGSDVELRREVEFRLGRHHSNDSLPHQPRADGALAPPDSLVGRTIRAYRVLSLLGVGGMGEVYLARDARLDRKVAIKVLPADVTSDQERRARFEHEARVLAAFRHPHIAGIHGFEDFDGRQALILEYIEGDTLEERVRTGPLRVNDALAIAHQIADAIDAAHEHGVVHRDLKPANVKVATDGNVSVLDFGLAKVVVGDRSGPDLSALSTMTAAATLPGAIVGTPRYMSPEQARGQRVDKRTDIWAFGCVLYELLTGRVAFPGTTVADTVAAILEREPDWRALPPATPPAIRRLLQRCLEKDSSRRLRDIGDAKAEIEDVRAGITNAHAAAAPAMKARTRSALVSGAAIAGVAALAAVTLFYIRTPAPPSAPVEVRDLTIAPPSGESLNELVGVAVSPDGTLVAFVADGTLWVKPIGGGSERALAQGTFAPTPPFWSPDGRIVGFFAGSTLKAVPLEGGPAVDVAEAVGRGATFTDATTILFGRESGAIQRVSRSGGDPIDVTSLAAGDTSHRWPSMLPDGDRFLYVAMRPGADNELRVGSLSSTATTSIGPARSQAVYDSGFLLYLNPQANLMARAFDLAALGFTEAPPILLAGATFHNAWGLGAFSSSNGVLAHIEGIDVDTQLTWMSRSGAPRAIGEPGRHFNVALSPDGNRLAVSMLTGPPANYDIWTLDLARAGSFTRMTSHRDMDFDPIWHPDGTRLFFSSNRVGGSFWMFERSSSGDGENELVADVPGIPTDISKDARFLAFSRAGDLWFLPLSGDRVPTPFLATPAPVTEGGASFSPDGQWIAYHSNASNRSEIYIRSFPSGQLLLRVSHDGGRAAQWRQDGRELFFLGLDGSMMAAEIAVTGGAISASPPVRLFETGLGTLHARPYAVSDDGQQFLITMPRRRSRAATITVMLDFPKRLER